MVKQGSFFQRLRERMRGPVRVDEAGGDAADAPPTVAAERVGADGYEGAVEARTTRKLSDREEALLAVGGHFQELTAMLRGSQARVDDQLARLVSSTSALPQLPTLSQQHLEALRTLSAQMERQNVLGEQLAARRLNKAAEALARPLDAPGAIGS